MWDFVSLRNRMIEKQVEERRIGNRAVLEAMRTVPREAFVPADLLGLAYEDGPVPLDEGQSMTQPFMVAYMTEALELIPGDRVLEIGTGTGCGAAGRRVRLDLWRMRGQVRNSTFETDGYPYIFS